jgi:phage terminase small subunit
MGEQKLNERQTDFVDYLVKTGCTPTEAARHAGYANPKNDAYRLLRLPHVAEAIRDTQSRVIGGDLSNIALKTLRDVMQDAGAPAPARVSAARAVLEMGGHYDREAREAERADKALSEMSIEELAELVRRGEEAMAAGTLSAEEDVVH